MRMRKFVFNGAVITAVVGLWSTIQSTKNGPKDWRVPLMWINAAIALVIAIGTVLEESHEADTREQAH